MKNVLKTILFTFHLQIFINLIFFLMIQFGFRVFSFHEQAMINTVLYAFSLMFIYFIVILVISFFRPKVLSYPYKAWVLLILLLGIYTLSFILSQSDFSLWKIYFISHLPVAYFVRSWLPSQFDLSQQFLIGLCAISPALGVKFAYEFSGWLKYRIKKSR